MSDLVKVAKSPKPAKVQKARKLASDEIEELFQLSKAERVKGRDGKNYDIFHRVSPQGGAYTKDALMQKCGYKAQLAEVEKDAQKRYKVLSEVRAVVRAREGMLKNQLNSRIHACKHKMTKEYEPLGLIPLMASVRMHSESEDRKLYIQGFCTLNGEFVIGNRDDAALWAIEVMSGAKGMAQKYRLATAVGKDLMNRNLIGGPLKDRLALTLKS